MTERSNFDNYKTFAFFKPGIDKAEISDLDKRRILRAIETEFMAKGYTKSENPDMLISIFTKAKQRVDVYNNAWGRRLGLGTWLGLGRCGWAWGPGWGWAGVAIKFQREQKACYLLISRCQKKELIWQGSGTGNLITKNVRKKKQELKNLYLK